MRKLSSLFIVGAVVFVGVFGLGSKAIKAAPSLRNFNQGNRDVAVSNKINDIIKKMTLDEKIGQLFISGAVADSEKVRNDIKKYHLGGITLYGDSFQNETISSFKQKINTFQKSSTIPLLIGTDQEGGTVSRLSKNPLIANGRSFHSPQDIYNKDGLNGVIKEAQEVSKILHDLGINWNYAPVADCTSDVESFIYERTLGQDYKTTADYISKVVPAWQQNVATALKHFPGYGSAIDTHTDFATVTKTLAQMEKEDLLPFKSGIASQADAIMVAHVEYTQIDPNSPASLSKKIVTDLLRNQLGFNGLIITDDLGMGAIEKWVKEHKGISADVMALQAGNDCLMNDDYATGIPVIKDAIQKGVLSEKEIDQHVFRILELKAKLGLL